MYAGYKLQPSIWYRYGFVEILRELHVHPVIPRDEGPPEVTDSSFY